MLQLSVVIIAFNEEKNIDRCLRSVKDVADEIVVVDSGSTDRTKDICLEHGVKFYSHPFAGHIEQKNKAITFASYPHILSLDADEALDEALSAEISRIKRNFTKQGYYMNRLTNYCGHWVKHCGWYPDRKLRLWDSRCGSWTGINPHDRFELHEGDKQAGYLKGNILHYSYYTVEDHYRQVEYFTTIAARAYYEKGRRSGALNLIVNPVAKFIDHYLLKRGFMDGKAGFLISRISAYATWLKYKKLKDLQDKEAAK